MSIVADITKFSLSKNLRVEEIHTKDYWDILELARQWQQMAYTKQNTFTPGNEAWSRLRSCGHIAGDIVRYLEQISPNTNKELYACKDSTTKIQGLAVIEMKPDRDSNELALVVHSLVTNPENIQCAANPERIEGVGRTFCQYVNQAAPKAGLKNIYLIPTASAIAFYEKFGFIHINDGSGTMRRSLSQPSSKL